MYYIVLFVLLPACIYADDSATYSFSPPVGSGSGASYVLSGEGRITAVRVWEWYYYYHNYIYGLQLRHGVIWSDVAGHRYGNPLEIELYEDESIIQISGKYSHYIQSIIFVTNKGRSLHAGRVYGHSFNMYPKHPKAELLFISGRYHGGLTSIAGHWGSIGSFAGNSTDH